MSEQTAARPRFTSRPIARIVYDARRRKAARSVEMRFSREFVAGDSIRSVALIRNDGMYPHKDIGEALVHPGDTGVVRESWRFLGEIYYTVEFIAQSVFVFMRDHEMTRTSTAFDVGA